MPSLTAKDRVSLCLFTFTDGRRCRTPRISSHPHFCFYHAQKESQSQATAKLAKDLAYFFSGDYLSANDLNTALGRLIPAVIRGEIKPRVARTVAYSSKLFSNPPAWPNTNTSTPSAPMPGAKPSAPPSTPTTTTSTRQTPTTPIRTTMLATAPSPENPNPIPADTEAALNIARSLFPDRANAAQSQPTAPTMNPAPAQTAQPNNAPPAAPLPPQSRRQQGAPNREPYAVHFDHTHRLLVDGTLVTRQT
jgi:hypothetical protein